MFIERVYMTDEIRHCDEDNCTNPVTFRLSDGLDGQEHEFCGFHAKELIFREVYSLASNSNSVKITF